MAGIMIEVIYDTGGLAELAVFLSTLPDRMCGKSVVDHPQG